MKRIFSLILLLLFSNIIYVQGQTLIRLSQIEDIDTINIVRTDWVAFIVNNSPIRTLSTTGAAGNVSISGGNSITLNVNDADASTTNEIISSVSYLNNIFEIQESGNVWQTEIISSSGGGSAYTNTVIVSDSMLSVTFPDNMATSNYYLYIRAWYNVTIGGKQVQFENGMYDFNKSVSGFSVKFKNPTGYLTYFAVDTVNWTALSFENYLVASDTLEKVETKHHVHDTLNNYWNKQELINTTSATWNRAYQVLSGTTPTFNVINGMSARDTLAGTTTITFANLVNGMNGNFNIVNATTAYDISFSGYPVVVSKPVRKTLNTVVTSGLGKKDRYSWSYDGIEITINGALDYE